MLQVFLGMDHLTQYHRPLVVMPLCYHHHQILLEIQSGKLHIRLHLLHLVRLLLVWEKDQI